jgi:YHS domain-containing protein
MKTILIICIFAIGFGSLYKSNAKEIKWQSVLTDSIKVDPVCKMKVKSPAKHSSTYQKTEYWFCGKGCQLKFDKNPTSFLIKASKTEN